MYESLSWLVWYSRISKSSGVRRVSHERMFGQQLYSAIPEEMDVVSNLKRNSNATTLFDVLREFCSSSRQLTNVFVWNGIVK